MKALNLGDEYDTELKRALYEVLRAMGATEIKHTHGHAGSQELEILEVAIGDERIVMEAETYMGLSIRGREDIVAEIGRRLAESLPQFK